MCGVIYKKSKNLLPLIEEILISGGRARLTVTGTSMYPFLRWGQDSVELSHTDFSGIYTGDIVVILRDNGQYIMHRVLKKKEASFYIIGDAQHDIEGPLYPHQLIAVVTAIWRKDRKIECTNFWWRLLSKLWLKLIPFRYFMIGTYRHLSKINSLSRNLWRRSRT
jgi:signal peptidase I